MCSVALRLPLFGVACLGSGGACAGVGVVGTGWWVARDRSGVAGAAGWYAIGVVVGVGSGGWELEEGP